MNHRVVTIKWTNEAKDGLRILPQKVRRGILQKADELAECSNPESAYKPLGGSLVGYRRFAYARYRAIFQVREDRVCNGDVHWHVEIVFIAVGKRKARAKDDIYRLAEKIAKYRILDIADARFDEDE